MSELQDKRDQRDPETLGKIILSRPDKTLSAHAAADAMLKVSKNGSQRDP